MVKRNKKVKGFNTKSPGNTVKNNTNPLLVKVNRENIWFDLQSNSWLKSIKTKDFTNFFYDSTDHSKTLFHLLYVLIPQVVKNWDSIISRRNGFNHCHLITDEEKRNKAMKIYKKIHGHELSEEVNIWSLGITGGERLICIFNDLEKALIPIFVDHHHLIFPSQKHNHDDFESSSFCAVCEYR